MAKETGRKNEKVSYLLRGVREGKAWTPAVVLRLAPPVRPVGLAATSGPGMAAGTGLAARPTHLWTGASSQVPSPLFPPRDRPAPPFPAQRTRPWNFAPESCGLYTYSWWRERPKGRKRAGAGEGQPSPRPHQRPLSDGREVWPGRTGSRGEAGRVTSGSPPGLLSPWVAVWEAALLQQSADWPCGRWDPEGSEPGQVPASAQVKQGEQPQGVKGSPRGPRSCSEHGDTPQPLVLGPSIRSLSTWGPVCRVSRGPVWMLTGTARGAGGSGPSSTAAFSCQPGPTVLSSHIQLVFPFRSPAPMPVEQ